MDEVILVDEHDIEIGIMEKMLAHQQGNLHRAISVFVFSENGQMLLQKRALKKYHSGGLLTNACCSHPKPTEPIDTSAARRLQEELGFETPLTKAFVFQYRTDFENGLIENEIDHVFIGKYTGNVYPNPEEVDSVVYKSIEIIQQELLDTPQLYTSWFHIAFPKVLDWIRLKGCY